jgi:hypothetical protein
MEIIIGAIFVGLSLLLGTKFADAFRSKKLEKLKDLGKELEIRSKMKKEDIEKLQVEEIGLKEAKDYWEKRRK